MDHRDLKIGDWVKFRDPAHERSWFLDESEGFVVGITRYGPADPVITAKFGARSVHIAEHFFERIDG
jgi:hypothetical protein